MTFGKPNAARLKKRDDISDERLSLVAGLAKSGYFDEIAKDLKITKDIEAVSGIAALVAAVIDRAELWSESTLSVRMLIHAERAMNSCVARLKEHEARAGGFKLSETIEEELWGVRYAIVLAMEQLVMEEADGKVLH